ncbi:hypothetical protein EVG20_g8857 [Dentipellis fragilis]|uniref:BTB domain-containing protein n=1 Tax=Dentipellis fragilis TaxID=205917 RepID=A0A4Y9Y3Y4_9AGAM|nr:hypothetical protein EVG20_g8857 [Dentipellis fragilis]
MATDTVASTNSEAIEGTPDGRGAAIIQHGLRADNTAGCSETSKVPAIYEDKPLGPRPYWFPDGDIVFQIEDSQFKLPRSLLFISDIFKDMFEMANCSTDYSVDGCPVVEIPDRASDWMVLLQWMLLRQESYTKALEFMEPEVLDYDSVRFRKVVGGLRLSTKYILPELRGIALAMFLDLFDSFDSPEALFWYSTEQAAEAIAVTYECQIPQLLPTLYYGLSVQYARDATEDGFMKIMDTDHLAHFRTIHDQVLSYHRHWTDNPLEGFRDDAPTSDVCVRDITSCSRHGLAKGCPSEDEEDDGQYGLLHGLRQIGLIRDAEMESQDPRMCSACGIVLAEVCSWRQTCVQQFISRTLGLKFIDFETEGQTPPGRPAPVRLPCKRVVAQTPSQ